MSFQKQRLTDSKTKTNSWNQIASDLKLKIYSQRKNPVIPIPAFKPLILSPLFKILLDIASIPLKLENSTIA